MIKLMKKVALPLMLGCVASTAHANLVTNGDFSTGDFTGWTVNDPSGSLDASTYDAEFGPATNYDVPPATPSTISQSISTANGRTYSISFDLSMGMGDGGNFFQVLEGANPLGQWSNTTVPPSTLYTYFFTASGPTTTIAFSGWNSASWDVLDNVVVNQVSAVPLPASGYLMLSALGIVGFMATRRSNKSAGTMNFA